MDIVLTIIIREKKTKYKIFMKLFQNMEILLLRYNRGSVMLPGGHIIGDEVSEAAAIREAVEELGLSDRVKLVKLKDYCEITSDNNHRYHLVVIHLTNGEDEIIFTPQAEEGIKEAFWINPTKLAYSFSFRYLFLRKKMSTPAIKAIKVFLRKPIANIKI